MNLHSTGASARGRIEREYRYPQPYGVADHACATLLDHGHQVMVFGGDAVHAGLLDAVNEHDGCLLLGDEPELGTSAQLFSDQGKTVWRDLAEIPPTKEWP